VDRQLYFALPFTAFLSALTSLYSKNFAVPHTTGVIKLLVENEVIEKEMPKTCLFSLSCSSAKKR
jgi:hypothetical protein